MIDVYNYWPHQDSFKYLLSLWIQTKHSSTTGKRGKKCVKEEFWRETVKDKE